MEQSKELEFNLQSFAEDGSEDSQATATTTEEENKSQTTTENKEPAQPQAKYTDEDLDRIISRKMAELTKKAEKESAKKAEAERLKNMSESEKKDHELQQLKAELAQMKKDSALSEMAKTARSILSESNIHVSDSLVANLISEDAESTKEAVESFAEAFNSAVEKAVAEKLKGNAPKKSGTNKSITKEEILKVTNAQERQKLISEHMELFK